MTSCLLPEFGTPSYGVTKNLGKSISFDAAVANVTAALKENGFGVLTTIDVRETMQKKIGADLVRPYVILGACNPNLALEALQTTPAVGLFLPCNVIVAQDPDESIIVSAISPREMFKVSGDPGVEPLAKKVQQIMEKVVQSL